MNRSIAALLLLVFAWQMPAQQGTLAFGNTKRFGSTLKFSGIWSLAQENDGFACPTSGTSCPVTLGKATTANSVIVSGLLDFTSTNITIVSASGGGGTFNICPSLDCNVILSGGSASGDLTYNVTGSGGATGITLILSGPCAACFVVTDEWICPRCSSGIVLDQLANSQGNSASCASCTASGFSSLAGNDLIVQLINFANSLAPPAPYVIDSGANFMYALGTSSPTAPVVTQSPSGSLFSSGLAFRPL